MKKQEYNAVLSEWRVGVSVGTGKRVLYGTISGDDGQRFKDGDNIRTSNVESGCVLNEGTIVQTRNTRYLLGKRAGIEFDDGHVVRNTYNDQMDSLRGYMLARGYVAVYTDSAVFFRLDDKNARTPNNQVSFRTAVVWHNKAAPFVQVYPVSQAGRVLSTPEDMAEFRKVKKLKLQKTGNRIIVQSHKITLVKQEVNVAAELVAFQRKPEPVDVVKLLESL